MANPTLITYIPAGPLFSCDLPDLRYYFPTKQGTATPMVTVYDSSDTALFQCSPTIHGSYANVYNLPEVMEAYMTRNGSPYSVFKVSMSYGDSTVETSLKVVFCRRKMTSDNATRFLTGNFMSQTTVWRVGANDSLTLGCMLTPNEEVQPVVNATYESGYGDIRSYSYELTGFNDSDRTDYRFRGLAVNVADILSRIRTISDSGSRMLSFSIDLGLRHAAFYVVAYRYGLVFNFCNVFNIMERVQLPGTLACNPKQSASLADFGKELSNYDITVDDIFEFSASTIHERDISAVRGLIESPLITIDANRFSRWKTSEITMESAELKVPDAYAGPASLKLKFRFTDTQQWIKPFRPEQNRIHTMQFNKAFN